MNDRKKQELCEEMARELPILRKALGVTQEQLASMAGVSRSTVICYERNKTMGWNTFLSLLLIFTRHEDTLKLIRAFGLYPDELDTYLLGRAGTEAREG